MTTQQPAALRLAAELCEAIAEYPEPTALEAQAAAELRRQHARITELEAQLAQRFDAADMATAAAQGFRDGAASVSAGSAPVANNRPSLEEVFRRLSDRAYCNYIEQIGRDACLGWEHKAAHGKFGEAELKGHTIAGEMLGRHKAFAEAANALRGSDAPLTHPSPPGGMVAAKEQQAGWEAIETAPKDGLRVILTEGGRVFRGVFVTVEFKEHRDSDGNYIDQTDPDAYWMELTSGDVCYPTHWQPEAPLPPPPSIAQKD